MQITVRHRTRYSYRKPVAFSAQHLRLLPGHHDGQVIVDWQVRMNGRVLDREGGDGYGNRLYSFYLQEPHEEIVVEVNGQALIEERAGVVQNAIETLPPLFYLRETDLTLPSAEIRGLASTVAQEASDSGLDLLHRLMTAIRAAVRYEIGQTHAATTASEALAAGIGVCQDHAQVFVSAARTLGIPARYVSGYLAPEGDLPVEASHAWAEAFVEGLGWVAFDVANGIAASNRHLRLAIGLDYRDAAPVRGVRRGGDEETLEVDLDVTASARQAQQ